MPRAHRRPLQPARWPAHTPTVDQRTERQRLRRGLGRARRSRCTRAGHAPTTPADPSPSPPTATSPRRHSRHPRNATTCRRSLHSDHRTPGGGTCPRPRATSEGCTRPSPSHARPLLSRRGIAEPDHPPLTPRLTPAVTPPGRDDRRRDSVRMPAPAALGAVALGVEHVGDLTQAPTLGPQLDGPADRRPFVEVVDDSPPSARTPKLGDPKPAYPPRSALRRRP